MRTALGLSGMGESIKIVLADDHAVVRSALRLLLDAEDDLEVVAEAGDIVSAVRYVARPQARCADPRPQHARRAEHRRGARVARRLARDRDRRADDGERPRIRARGAADRRARLRAQGGGRQGARQRGSARGRGRTYLQPELGARLAADPAEDADDLSDRELDVLRLSRSATPTSRSPRTSSSACERSSPTAPTSSRSCR